MGWWAYHVLFVVGGTSSTLSILGSLLVCKLVMQKQNERTILDRLMLGLSISDIITSAANASQPFVLPADSLFPFAMGDKTTCQISGFWLTFTVTSGIYAAGLAIYFFCFAMTDRYYEWPRRVEPFIHGIAWTTGLLMACASVQWIRLKRGMGICHISCDEDCIDAPEVARIVSILWNVYGAILFTAAMVGIGFTTALWRGFKQQQERNSRYSTISNLQMLGDVTTQSVFYISAYVNSLIGISLSFVCDKLCTRQSADLFQNPSALMFISNFFIYLMFPMQGFLNCLVYTRPRLVQWRKLNPSASWFWCFRQVFYGRNLPPRQTYESQVCSTCSPARSPGDAAARSSNTLSFD